MSQTHRGYDPHEYEKHKKTCPLCGESEIYLTTHLPDCEQDVIA